MVNGLDINKLAEEISKKININLIDPPELFTFDIFAPLRNFFDFIIKNIWISITNFISFLNDTILTNLINGLKWLFDKVSNLIKSVFEQILNFIKDNLTPAEPDKAISKMLFFMATGTALLLNINVILSVAQTQILGNKLDLKPISDFINNLLDARMLSSITFGIILSRAFETPLRYWANATFKPFLPSGREAWIMWRTGYIDFDTYIKIFAYSTGLSEKFRKGIEEIWDYNLSISELFRISRAISLPIDFIRRKLLESGVEDEDINYIIRAVLREPVRDEVEKVASDLYNLYAEGWITRQQLENSLKSMEFSAEEIFWRLAHADFIRFRRLKNLKSDIFVLMFRKDLINSEELRNNLLAIGLDLENVNLIVDAEVVRKGIKPVFKVSQNVDIRTINLSAVVNYNII